KRLWGEFVAFIFSGNLIMIAVAFVLGALTTQVIKSFVDNIVNPFISIFFGRPTFDNTFTINDAVFGWGAFITVLINLVITGLVLFAIVKMYDAYRARKQASGEEDEPASEDIALLREIRDLLAAQRSQ
ncbi:MAG TPA: MscL family protein, partial [Acidimicrobiia bacterium]|nr:MscL family protein [Acidimicrobiia bacterium]